MVETSMKSKAQIALEELGFNFSNIEERQTDLSPQVENLIYNKLAEADIEITDMEIHDDEKVIAHAMIFVINASMKVLYKNVVEDIANRIKQAIPKVEVVEEDCLGKLYDNGNLICKRCPSKDNCERLMR